MNIVIRSKYTDVTLEWDGGNIQFSPSLKVQLIYQEEGYLDLVIQVDQEFWIENMADGSWMILIDEGNPAELQIVDRISSFPRD